MDYIELTIIIIIGKFASSIIIMSINNMINSLYDMIQILDDLKKL